MSEYIQAAVTVLSLVNPAICAAMFTRIESGRPANKQVVDATGAAAMLLTILIVAALVGAKVLSTFGISLDAFRVAGGGVLAWMGFSMVSAPAPTGEGARASDTSGAAPSLVPLILFAASPGTITGVITLAVHQSHSKLPVTAIVGIVLAVAITWAVLLLVTRRKPSPGGPGLGQQVVSKFMGLIVLAMGVQFALSGLKAFMGTG